MVLKPDAYAVVHVGGWEDRFFVEADCSTIPGSRITSKARMYVDHWQSGEEQAQSGIYPYVLWMTVSDRRKTFLIEALARLPAEHWRLFVVTTADEAADLISSGTTTTIDHRKEVKS
jgi:hypothetical protein